MSHNADALDAFEKSIGDAAGQFGVIWISFLTFVTYLVVTIGSVTHRMLFEESPVKLPVFGIDLPLIGFFLVAPLLLLILHFYVLLQLLAIAEKIGRFDTPDTEDKRRLRLNHFVFVRYFFRAHGEGGRLTRLSATIIVAITIILAPLAILIQAQLTFLPYHHWLTWWHRGAVLIDVALVFVFWSTIRAVASNETSSKVAGDETSRKMLVRGWTPVVGYFIAFVIAAALAVFSVLIATYPGETQHRGFLASIHDWLFLRGINPATGERAGLLANTLVLPDVDFLDDSKRLTQDTPLSLRGRDLRGAILIRANLRKVDFAGANLMDAQLDYAWLRAARFNCSYDLKDLSRIRSNRCEFLHKPLEGWPKDHCTWLQGASLVGARMQDAWFLGARLQGTRLQDGELEMASLECAHLQGAHLEGAHLVAARLTRADLDGASLDGAQLQGADIDGAIFANVSFAARCQRKPRTPDAFPTLRMVAVWRTHGKPSGLIVSRGKVDATTPMFDSEDSFKKWQAEIVPFLPNEASKQRAQYKLATLAPGPAYKLDGSRPALTDWSQVPQDQDTQPVCQ